MSFESERAAIEQRLATNWTATDIAYDNVPYDPQVGVPFVQLYILDGGSNQVSLGPGAQRHRRVGVISINIFTPANTGTKTSREYADSIAAIFRSQQFNGIVCQSPSITRIGQEGNWFQTNVSIPFWTDEIL